MIQTNCSGCVFATITDNKQTDCKLNRIKKLGSENTIEHNGIEFFTISRFCNAFRPSSWLDQLSLDESLDVEKAVLKEVEPRVGFLIYLETNNKQDALEDLKVTINGLKNQTQGQPRYIIVATEKVEYNEGVHDLLSENFDQEQTEIHVLQLLIELENKFFIIDEAFRLALNGWLYVTTSGEPIDKNLLKDLHNHLNIKMNKLSVVLPYDGINGFLVQTALFKYLNGNKTKVWDIDNHDSRMFLEKIRDIDNTGDCILTWDEVNAS